MSEYKLMQKQMEVLLQYHENETARVVKWATFRDRKMAENIGWIKEQEQPGHNKLLVWAHSGHLNNVNLRMGSYLKKLHPDYFVLGQDFISGETNAMYQRQTFTYKLQEEPGLMANYFIQKPGNTFFIHFRHPGFKTSALEQYMGRHPLLRNEGARKNYMKIKPGKQFDALIIHRTSATKW